MTEHAHVLVTTPHPDDAETRFAGSVAKWTREGKNVVYVVISNGDKGTNDPEISPEILAATREKEQLAAAEILGIKEVVFLRYPDQGLENTPELRRDIVRQIRIFKPEIVVTVDPHGRYMDHRDHRIVGYATVEAVYPAAGSAYAFPELLDEGLTPHQVSEMLFSGRMQNDYFEDVSETIDVKVSAISCHRSQVGDRPDFGEMLKDRARMVAQDLDFEYAEGFHREVIRWEAFSYSI
ncbi:MAG: PIG-L family deacetylase [Dehalococcoidales bacterium]|nr:MAG: PIG-L family deacetylase [Dehalococcoidales bacterium]